MESRDVPHLRGLGRRVEVLTASSGPGMDPHCITRAQDRVSSGWATDLENRYPSWKEPFLGQ